jgi:hypothetical protein
MGKVIKFVLGIFFISLALLILTLLFSEPHNQIYYIIYFFSILLILIGLAAILKGFIVKSYSLLYRRLNILIGFLTLTFCFLGIYYADVAFLFYLITLTILLASNGLLRSALYLSEYGLSLKKISNLRFVFYIMNTYQLKLPENEESD